MKLNISFHEFVFCHSSYLLSVLPMRQLEYTTIAKHIEYIFYITPVGKMCIAMHLHHVQTKNQASKCIKPLMNFNGKILKNYQICKFIFHL